MFDANGAAGGVDSAAPEDMRVIGYDPMITPALIQEEIPAVCLRIYPSPFDIYIIPL